MIKGLNVLLMGYQSHFLQHCHSACPVLVTKDLIISPQFSPYDFFSRCKLVQHSYRSSTNGSLIIHFSYSRSHAFPLEEIIQILVFTRIELTISALTSRCTRYVVTY